MSSLPHKIFYSQIIPLGILSSLLVTFNKTDVLIMSRFLENYTVGVLFFALKIVGITNIFILSALTVYGPTLVKLVKTSKIQEASDLIRKNNYIVLIIGLFTFTVWLGFGRDAIAIINSDYTDAYQYTLILLGLFILTNTFFSAAYIAVHTLSKRTLIFFCMSLIVNVS